MRQARPGAADASRDYLRLNMRPLTAGGLRPNRRNQDRDRTAAIVVGCLAAILAVVAPVVFFLSIFGDPFGRAFVERRADGLYAQLRACDGDTVHAVEVAPYDGHSEQPVPFWIANSSVPGGAESVKLFSAQPMFDISTTDIKSSTIFEVTINKGLPSESAVVVDELALDPGKVEFGGEPVSRANYDAMDNSDFGCPP